MGASSGKVVCGVALLTAVLSLGYSGYDTYRLVDEESSKDAISLDENGEYNSKEEVAPGKSIGGDRFYALYDADRGIPKTEGRYYTECDVNTDGKSERGSERLIFSNDGIILYTGDHYQTFEIVYGDEVLSEFYKKGHDFLCAYVVYGSIHHHFRKLKYIEKPSQSLNSSATVFFHF